MSIVEGILTSAATDMRILCSCVLAWQSLKSGRYRKAIEILWAWRAEEPKCGRRRIISHHGSLNLKTLLDAGAPGDPGNVHIVGSVEAVSFVVAAMVGGDDEDTFAHNTGIVNGLQNYPDRCVHIGKGLF